MTCITCSEAPKHCYYQITIKATSKTLLLHVTPGKSGCVLSKGNYKAISTHPLHCLLLGDTSRVLPKFIGLTLFSIVSCCKLTYKPFTTLKLQSVLPIMGLPGIYDSTRFNNGHHERERESQERRMKRHSASPF